MKEQGYAIHCYFLWLPSVEMAFARVAHRVSEGGHDIPEATIRRRFAAGLGNFFGLYQPLFDSWRLYNNSMTTPELVALETSGRTTVLNDDVFLAATRAVENEP
jgi:predicted ABC-type ATPase